VVICENVTAGENNNFFPFCVIGSAPQVEQRFDIGTSAVVIGSQNTFREYVTIQPGIEKFGGTTRIGDHNLFMISSHVGHDCIIGNHNRLTNNVPLAGHVMLGDYVIISGLSAVTQFVRIGSHAFIGAASIASADIPPFCMAEGSRATLVGINSVGLGRHGFTDADVAEIKTIFRRLFMAEGLFAEKLAILKIDYAASPHAAALFEFIDSSEKGIAPFVPRREKKDA
jgi:UDP-N-acetylglucosamine acyltransferase